MSLRRFVVPSAGALVLLASCAGNDELPAVIPSDVEDAALPPPPAADAGSDAADDVEAKDVAVAPPAPTPPVQPCNASSPCPVVVAAPIPNTRNLVAISGSGPSDVWAVGSSSTVLHFDGDTWEAPTSWQGGNLGQNTVRSVWASSEDVWFIDGDDLVHASGWHGAASTTFERAAGAFKRASVTPVIANDLAGNGGEVWSLVREDAFGAGLLVRWSPWSNGDTTAVEHAQFSLNLGRFLAASWADADSFWVVGEKGKVYRTVRTGTEPPWRAEEWNSHATTTLADVSTKGSEVWIVGQRGLIRRRGVDPDGTTRFLVMDSGSIANLTSVHVFAGDDVWIVGEEATILHFDGTSWWRVPTPFDTSAKRPKLHAVWGASPNDVWFIGQGVTLRLQRSNQ